MKVDKRGRYIETISSVRDLKDLSLFEERIIWLESGGDHLSQKLYRKLKEKDNLLKWEEGFLQGIHWSLFFEEVAFAGMVTGMRKKITGTLRRVTPIGRKLVNNPGLYYVWLSAVEEAILQETYVFRPDNPEKDLPTLWEGFIWSRLSYPSAPPHKAVSKEAAQAERTYSLDEVVYEDEDGEGTLQDFLENSLLSEHQLEAAFDYFDDDPEALLMRYARFPITSSTEEHIALAEEVQQGFERDWEHFCAHHGIFTSKQGLSLPVVIRPYSVLKVYQRR